MFCAINSISYLSILELIHIVFNFFVSIQQSKLHEKVFSFMKMIFKLQTKLYSYSSLRSPTSEINVSGPPEWTFQGERSEPYPFSPKVSP